LVRAASCVVASEGDGRGESGGSRDPPGARGASTGARVASGGHHRGQASGVVGTPWALEGRPSGRSWGRNSGRGALWGRGWALTEGAGD